MQKPAAAMLPSGMLTVMFTDLEDSTRLWEHAPVAMRAAMETHDDLLYRTVAEFDGIVFKHTGDGVAAVFASPNNAATCAIEIQRRFQTHEWQDLERLKVRIGLHMGDVEPTGDQYFGPPINRAARIMDVGNGDQITVSGVASRFMNAVEREPMGEHQLKGIGTETIDMISSPDLVRDERPLRARVSRAVKMVPAPSRALVGRGQDSQRMAELITNHQLVTVTGPGGVGKTHFATSIAYTAQQHYEDGAILCELSRVDDPNAVLDVIATSIGARVQPEMTLLESIIDFLADREMLLVLDNCEHVLAPVTDFIGVVAAFPRIHLVCTSRESLGSLAEQVFTLEPLDPLNDAVDLFIERAQERDLSFEPTSADRATIASICQQVDGMPLAVELAAAWVRVLTLDQLLERLDDRFEVLDRTRSPGHRQALRETVQWSYDHLDDPQKRLFERLSVFSGGFSLDAAVEVCAHADSVATDIYGVLDIVMSLVDKSMVMSDRGADRIRFTMLSTLKQFGAEQLAQRGDLSAVQDRHAAVFLDLARTSAEQLVSSKEADTWDLLDREWANIRTAFARLLEGDDLDGATELVRELGWFATLSVRPELFGWAEELLERDGSETRSGAASLFGLRAIRKYLTIDPTSSDDARRGLELDPNETSGFCRLALSAESLNNALIAEDSEERTQAWLDTITDDSPVMSHLWALGMRVFHLCTSAPSPDAASFQAEMSRIADDTGSASAMSLTRWAGGMLASFESPAAALDEWDKGLDSARSVSDVHLLVHLIAGLELHFTASRGDLDQVLERCVAILEQAHSQHYLAGTSHLFGVTAIVLSRVDRAQIGAELLGSMLAHGHVPRGNARRAIERSLGDHAQAAIDGGRHRSTNEAVVLATDALRAAIAERRSSDLTAS